MDTHLITPPLDLPAAIAARRADELGYATVSAVLYTDAGRRQVRQLEQIPWTLELLRARGHLVDVDAPTVAQQADAIGRIAEAVMASNTPSGAGDFEIAVFAPKGMGRVCSRRVRCQVLAPLAGQGDPFAEELGADAPPSPGPTLGDADALAAAPGLAAVMAAARKLVALMEEVPAMMLRHMATMETQWSRVVKAREGEVERLERIIAQQGSTIQQLAELAEDSGAVPSAVPPEVVREGLEEVGSTLKAGLMHLLGAPHEMVGLVDAWKALPEDVRRRLVDPATLAKLKDPNTQAVVGHLLANLP